MVGLLQIFQRLLARVGECKSQNPAADSVVQALLE